MKTILLDFDWTIANSFDNIINCINKLSSKYKYQKIDKTSLIRDENIKNLFSKINIRWYNLPFYMRDLKNSLKDEIDQIELFKDFIAYLTELKNEYNLVILSSNNSETIKKILEKNQIDIFHNICPDSSLFGKHKTIKKYLKQNNIPFANTIYVGDEIRDIHACQKAWIPIIAVSWWFNNRPSLFKNNPDYLADNIDEFKAILDLHFKNSN